MPGPPATFSVEMTPDTQSALANAIAAAAAAGPPPSGPPADPASSSNEFRDRFHRSLTVPAPFRSFNEQDGQGVPPPGSMTQTMDPNGPPRKCITSLYYLPLKFVPKLSSTMSNNLRTLSLSNCDTVRSPSYPLSMYISLRIGLCTHRAGDALASTL